MAVAVKTSSGVPSNSLLTQPALLSLFGMVYLLGTLIIVFGLIPQLWWSAWSNLGMGEQVVLGSLLLFLVDVACLIGLFVAGRKLIGEDIPSGVRAGAFVAFVGITVVLLLARWASIHLENAAYYRSFDPTTGAILSALVALTLLGLWIWIFTREWMQRLVVQLEAGGWFHATSYKPNQGQQVRRGTIFGILVIVGAGIYTLIAQGSLRSGPADWVLNIPFTGKVALESFGDVESYLNEAAGADTAQVQIRWAPPRSGWRSGQVMLFKTYRSEVLGILQQEEKLRKAFETELPNPEEAAPTAFLMAVSKRIFGDRIKEVLERKEFRATANRLGAIYDQAPWEDMSAPVAAVYNEARNLDIRDPDLNLVEGQLGVAFQIPVVTLLLDEYTLRDVNAKAESYVRITWTRDADPEKFKFGAIVTKEAFEAEKERIEQEKQNDPFLQVPEAAPLRQAWGETSYATLMLLPSVQFTLPLLLLAVSLWLAWRVVNMPTFADFLIATEAEMNKVSWSTQKRLVQDTIVVLVTVFLMAVFLFVMDYGWKLVLSARPIPGVLHFPKEAVGKNTKTEDKPW